MSSENDRTIKYELPEGALVSAELLIVSYLLPDGKSAYSVHSRGGAPMTTYLGLTVVAQDSIREWGHT